jgi:hypothetical protein
MRGKYFRESASRVLNMNLDVLARDDVHAGGNEWRFSIRSMPWPTMNADPTAHSRGLDTKHSSLCTAKRPEPGQVHRSNDASSAHFSTTKN